MKKALFVLGLGVMLTLSLAACTSDSAPDVTPTPVPPAATDRVDDDGAGGTVPGGDVTDDDMVDGDTTAPVVPEMDDTARDVGDAARDVTRGVGDAARDVADGVGDAARDVTRGVENAMR